MGSYSSVCTWMLSKYHLQVQAYTATDATTPTQDFQLAENGKKVYPFSKLPYQSGDCNLVIATSNKYSSEIKVHLRTCGFDHFFVFDERMNEEALSWYLFEIFQKHHIDAKQKVMFFSPNMKAFLSENNMKSNGDFKFWNPLLENDMVKSSFLSESRDLILPYLNEWELVVEGPYEWDQVCLNQGKGNVIDCGANIGLFSAYAAYRGYTVYAFEPVAQNIQYLKNNVSLYPEKIIVEPYALSNKNATSSFYLCNTTNEVSTLLQENCNENDFESVKVETKTIDQFVRDNNLQSVDFIKADIEGAERLMLEGAFETLRNFAPNLSICTYHLDDDKIVLEKLIKQANPAYKIIHHWKKLYAYVE